MGGKVIFAIFTGINGSKYQCVSKSDCKNLHITEGLVEICDSACLCRTKFTASCYKIVSILFRGNSFRQQTYTVDMIIFVFQIYCVKQFTDYVIKYALGDTNIQYTVAYCGHEIQHY